MKKLLLIPLFALIANSGVFAEEVKATTNTVDKETISLGFCLLGHKHDIPDGPCRTHPFQD